MKKFSVKRELPEPPPVPESRPEHPLGDDYLAVVELIADVWKTSLEVPGLKKALNEEISDVRNSFDRVWAYHFGSECMIPTRDAFKKDLKL